MIENIKYKISVNTTSGKTLTYNVNSFEMIEGGLIKFIDLKFNKVKIFDSRLCEIEEVTENE